MPLFCQGRKVLDDGELVLLARGVNYTSPTLTAMAVGGRDVDPNTAARLLDIEIRLAALGDPTVMDLVDRGLDRLAAAFPQALSGMAARR